MTEQDKSLKDLMDQKVEIPMKKGTKAVIGSMDLESLCWATEKFGSLEEFQNLFSDDKAAFKHLPAITEFVFQLLENQDDFDGVKDFRRHFPITAIEQLTGAIMSVISGSMPDMSDVKADEQSGGK